MSLGMLMCLTASCAMPPRDAWRIVQSQGLISYMTGDYTTVPNNRYVATAAPLQPRRPVYTPYLSSDMERPRREVVPYRPREERIVTEERTFSEERNFAVERDVTDESPSKPAPARAKSKARSEKMLSSAEKKDPVEQAPAPKLSIDALPFGTPVAGRPGMVMSPFATKEQLVDVTGMGSGDPVKCPYSGKLFRVPPTQQASSSSSSTNKEPEPPPPTTPSPPPSSSPSPSPAPSTSPEPPAPAPAPDSDPAPAKP
jgi:hypothetical protein